jgi:hypothetical protein
MPVPTLITDLSTTAASNFPAGSDAPSTIDDTLRAQAAFIAQLRDGPHVPSLGSAGAPAYAFVADTNTGAFSPGADLWGVSTGGTERARIDGSGHVGIGGTPDSTIVPTGTNRVVVKYAGAVTISAYDTSTGTSRVGMFADSANSVVGWDTSYATTFNGYVWRTVGSEWMRLAVDGLSFLVGGTAPTLSINSRMTFELTSNTQLKVLARGSDGVTRSVTLTLA